MGAGAEGEIEDEGAGNSIDEMTGTPTHPHPDGEAQTDTIAGVVLLRGEKWIHTFPPAQGNLVGTGKEDVVRRDQPPGLRPGIYLLHAAHPHADDMRTGPEIESSDRSAALGRPTGEIVKEGGDGIQGAVIHERNTVLAMIQTVHHAHVHLEDAGGDHIHHPHLVRGHH